MNSKILLLGIPHLAGTVNILVFRGDKMSQGMSFPEQSFSQGYFCLVVLHNAIKQLNILGTQNKVNTMKIK